jgi:hypothetical protein
MKRVVAVAVFAATAAVAADAAFADPVADACMSRTLYSDETCACVGMRAEELSIGQQKLLVATVDADGNIVSTHREAGLDLDDAARINSFIWTTAPSCVADRL